VALLVLALGFAGGASAAGNTLRLDPATTQVANGATFSIKVIQNADIATSGTSTSIGFNKAILQVTSVTRGAAFAAAPLFLAGDATAIAAANKSGKLQNVAAAFFPPTSVAAGEKEFITVGFKAIACGSVNLTVPTGRVDSTMLDGRTASYGTNLKITTAGATINVCEGGGAVAGASAGSSEVPGSSDTPGASGSLEPNATASHEPVAGGSVAPGVVAGPSAGPTIDAGLVSTSAEQSGWLNFALAALAVAAAGLATLIIVLTLIAIVGAVVGTVVVIRVWRRYAARDAVVTATSVVPVEIPAPATAGADGSLADLVGRPATPSPAGARSGAAIPVQSAQP